GGGNGGCSIGPLTVLVDAEARHNWMQRYEAAMAAPGESPEQLRAKYSELVSVCREFTAAAVRCATVIIDELYVSIDAKTMKVRVQRTLLDGTGAGSGGNGGSGGRRLHYEAFGMRLEVCTDDHGIFDGSDDLAAKALGGRERLGSLEYMKCHVPGLTVPLTATVDYHGHRVVAVALLPTRQALFSDAGRLRRWREDMVHGTADRGRRILGGPGDDRLLDQKLETVAKRLNLSRHGVRGADELGVHFLWASADIRGFRAPPSGGSTAFCLLNFWRALPPEDPEATPHLPQSKRGQSIFWRGLRPELVRTHSEPLSPDANGLATAGAPDWKEQREAVLAASRRLVDDVIPVYAEELRRRGIG
ncbi:unnamed protein product, partial [Phaeothamnion confervicola]